MKIRSIVNIFFIFVIAVGNLQAMDSNQGFWERALKTTVKGIGYSCLTAGGIAMLGATSTSCTPLDPDVPISKLEEFRIRFFDGLHWLGTDKIAKGTIEALRKNRKKITIQSKQADNQTESNDEESGAISFPVHINPFPIKQTIEQATISSSDKDVLAGMLEDIKNARIADHTHLDETLQKAFSLGQRGGMKLLRIVDAFLYFHAHKKPQTRSQLYQLLYGGISDQMLKRDVEATITSPHFTEKERIRSAWTDIRKFYRMNVLESFEKFRQPCFQIVPHYNEQTL